MKTVYDVFMHNLKEMYFIEKFLVEALGKLKREVSSAEIRRNLDIHQKETKQHVKNIEEIFSLVDERSKEHKSDVWKAMEKETDSFFSDVVLSEARDFFVLGVAVKSERLEISHYEALILLTKEIDFENKTEILKLLRENLVDEERALKKMQSGMKSQLPVLERMVH